MRYLLIFAAFILCTPAWAQLTAPTIAATAKGPDQINLTWSAASSPGYGYLVEIQSASDSRYSSFTQLQPIPNATGYTASGGNACQVSDTSGQYVFNPANLGISAPLYGLPTWVVESNYIDPQDGSAAQFIAFGLKPNTSYSFRVRTFTPSAFSSYSNTASATTSNYTPRYVNAATGNDSNGGTNSTSDAWLTINHAASTVTAGTVVLVEAGTYASDQIWPAHSGSATSYPANKIVFEADTGASVQITTPASAYETVFLNGVNYVVIDGINIQIAQQGDYSVYVTGNHDVLANLAVGPSMSIVPQPYDGIFLESDSYTLVYGVYAHDSNYPCSAQNPDGNSGWVLAAVGSTYDVIWSSHFTRGGHDTGLCKGVSTISGPCQYNRWLNNAMDGGYGLGWEDVANASNNLFEGNVLFSTGALESGIYKPGVEISGASTSMRRNVIINPTDVGLELSELNGLAITSSLFYKNVIYNPTISGSTGGDCFWKNNFATSTSLFVANNICTTTVPYNGSGEGEIAYSYITDTTDTITHNDLLYINGGVASPSTANILWNITSGGSCSSSPCNVATMDSSLNPPWSNNNTYAVLPSWINSSSYDFHLSYTSVLVGAATSVTDSGWGTIANANIGAFDGSFSSGISLSGGITISKGITVQ